MNRRRNVSQVDPSVQRLRTVRQLAQKHQAPINEFRHVEVWFHDGNQWTMASRWERLLEGQWVELPWMALTEITSRATSEGNPPPH